MKSKPVIIALIVIVLLISGIFIFAFNYKKNEEYYKIERNIKEATYKFLTDTSNLPTEDSAIDVALEDLIKNKYLEEIYLKGNKCDGNIFVRKGKTKYKYEMKIACYNTQYDV